MGRIILRYDAQARTYRTDDGREAYVTGCRAILSYDETMVTIDAGGVLVFIRGEELDIVRYCERDITVRGRIFSVGTEEEGGAV